MPLLTTAGAPQFLEQCAIGTAQRLRTATLPHLRKQRPNLIGGVAFGDRDLAAHHAHGLPLRLLPVGCVTLGRTAILHGPTGIHEIETASEGGAARQTRPRSNGEDEP